MEFEGPSAACDAISQDCPALQFTLDIDRYNEQWKDDATWILTSSFVILTMQSGFGLLEIGSSTPGNEVNTMLKNVADILFGALAFYFVGYGIAYGQPSNSFMGLGDFMPDDVGYQSIESGILYSRYLFQLSFAATSATIVSGCIAMRMRFCVYCAFAFYAVVIYSFVAHWVWADDGWLLARGYIDFAGGSAVHFHGAMNGLVAILFVGPRKGRFDGTRPESDFEESSPTSMLFGLFMLWWGWIGFNCGSTFGISGSKWMVAARAGVNTLNASSAGGMASIFYSKYRSGGEFVRPPDVVNGILGALVASSPTCASVHTYDSLIIGFLGAILTLWTNDTLVKSWLQLDDPVGAIGVHAVGGVWGIICVALFADADLPGIDIVASGLFRGGGFQLMGIQLTGLAAIAGWSLVTMIPFFYIVGVMISKDWWDPRAGLRLDYYQMDLIIHGCSEDPTPKITEEIEKALDRDNQSRHMTMQAGLMGMLPNLPSGLARTLFTHNEEMDGTGRTMLMDEPEQTSRTSSSDLEEEGDIHGLEEKQAITDHPHEDDHLRHRRGSHFEIFGVPARSSSQMHLVPAHQHSNEVEA